MKPYTPKDPLEKSPIWQDANYIAEHIYSKLAELPDEEKWNIESDLRGSATDVLYYVSQAFGTGTPGGAEYELGNARKYASSLKAMYRFAAKQQYFELEPEIMVKLNNMIAAIDSEIAEAHKASQKVNADDLAHWQKKYKLWKEMS